MLGREGFTQISHDGVVVEALDRTHGSAVARDGIGDTGARRRTIELDRARAADTMLAAQVRAGEAKVLAEEVGELEARLEDGAFGAAVDGELDGFVHCGGLTPAPR